MATSGPEPTISVDARLVDIEETVEKLDKAISVISEGESRVLRYLSILGAGVAALFGGMFAVVAVLIGVSYFYGSAQMTSMQRQVDDGIKRLDNRVVPSSVVITTDYSTPGSLKIVGEMYIVDDDTNRSAKHTFKLWTSYSVKIFTTGHGSAVATGLWYRMSGQLLPAYFRSQEGVVDDVIITDTQKGYIVDFSGIKTITHLPSKSTFYISTGSLECGEVLKRMNAFSAYVDPGEIELAPALEDDQITYEKTTFKIHLQRQVGSWLCNDQGLVVK
jgi:hypothetical protein